MTADDRPDPVRINPSLGEGAVSVSEATPMEQAWQALAVEAGPAKSLARLETGSARVVTTIATVAAPLAGLGLVAAGQPATAGWPRVLAVVSVVLAFAAVLFALAGQVLTVNPDLNLNNLADVEAWYRDLFTRRAPRTRTATILIVAATAAAGAAAILTLATSGRGDTLTLAVTRTVSLPNVNCCLRKLLSRRSATILASFLLVCGKRIANSSPP